jgi:hypothetical protein
MITKKVLVADRIRRIDGSFSFIPHRFLTGGFLAALSQSELLLYIFLVLAADRYGLSYYSYERICSLLHISLEQYISARDGLMKKDLLAFDGTIYQVLQLPQEPLPTSPAVRRSKNERPVSMAQALKQSLKGIHHE